MSSTLSRVCPECLWEFLVVFRLIALKVLELRTDSPIILAIIYESVARRLGIHLEFITCSTILVLRFKVPHKKSDAIMDIEFKGGFPCQVDNSLFEGLRKRPAASFVEVVNFISSRLSDAGLEQSRNTKFRHSVLDLIILINPRDFETHMRLEVLYRDEKVDMEQLRSIHRVKKRILRVNNVGGRTLKDLELHERKRTNSLMYAVGMMVINTSTETKCVIVDWTATGFYYVMYEGGLVRKIEQEKLRPCIHGERFGRVLNLGRHFSHWFENHYVPHVHKEREFFEDRLVRYKMYQNIKQKCYGPK